DGNPFGALISAALATARLHALQLAALGVRIPQDAATWCLNAFALESNAGGPPLPYGVLHGLPTLLIGAGPLGTSFTSGLSHLPRLEAIVDAVDDDFLRPSNANRQITAPFDRCRDGKTRKVDDLAMCWAAIRPFGVKYDDFKFQQGRTSGTYDIAVTAVD